MEHVFKREELPSGKVVMRHFGDDGLLADETHVYGLLAIGIKFDFRAGAKTDETYFVKGQMANRQTYEKARAAYPDMPKADDALEDFGGKLLSAAAKQRRQRAAKAKEHKPDPKEARIIDAFCSKLLKEGQRENAVTWVGKQNRTLGERDWKSSKRLVERLSALGCVEIYACDVDTYEDGFENTGHLVVELPTEAATRSKLFKALDRLASEIGYNGDFDNGQRYAYIKLD